MKLADIKVSWIPSPSPDVVGIKIFLKNLETQAETVVELPPESASHVFKELKEKMSYLVTVRLTDGTNHVDTTAQIDIPDLEKPQPVTNLGFEIVKVYDLVGPSN